MDLQTIKAKLQNIKGGEYFCVVYQKEVNVNDKTYKKVAHGSFRLVNYANIKGVEVKGKTNPNEKKDGECNYVKYNEKTKNTLVTFATTPNKTKTKYYEVGCGEIDRDTFLRETKARKPRMDQNGNVIVSPVVNLNINDILFIGSAFEKEMFLQQFPEYAL